MSGLFFDTNSCCAVTVQQTYINISRHKQTVQLIKEKNQHEFHIKCMAIAL